MAQPFRQQTEDHTKEIRMQEFYNSLDDHLKGEYKAMQIYRDSFIELGEAAHKFGDSQLERNLGFTIATIDKFLYGSNEVLDIVESLPTFNRVLENMIIEARLDLDEKDGGSLIY